MSMLRSVMEMKRTIINEHFVLFPALYSDFQVLISIEKCEKYLCSFRQAPTINLLETFFMFHLVKRIWYLWSSDRVAINPYFWKEIISHYFFQNNCHN